MHAIEIFGEGLFMYGGKIPVRAQREDAESSIATRDAT